MKPQLHIRRKKRPPQTAAATILAAHFRAHQPKNSLLIPHILCDHFPRTTLHPSPDGGSPRVRTTAFLASRLLEPHRHAISRRLQRQRPEIPRHLPYHRHQSFFRRRRSQSPPRRLPLRPPVHSLFHDRRLFRRPLQQTLRHHLDQSLRARRHALRNRGLRGSQHAHVHGRRIPRQHPRRSFRPVEIWPAARNSSRETPLLGQRRHRTRHLPRRHHRYRSRRPPLRSLRRPRILFRNFLPGVLGNRPRHQLRHFESPRRRPGQNISRQSPRRSLVARQTDWPRQGPLARGSRQYLLLLPRRSPPIRHRFLRPRRPPRHRNP